LNDLVLVVLDGRRTVVDEAHAELVRRQAAQLTRLWQDFAGLEGGDEGFVPHPIRPLGHFPATATYVAYDYAPLGETGQIIVTVFVGDKYYQSTFQVHVVTKDSGHDGATARSVGVAALAGIAAVLLMG